MKFVIDKEQTLLEALITMNPDSSKNTLRGWVEKGRALVNGRPLLRCNDLVLKGDKLSLGNRVSFINDEIKVIYEDKHLIVIDKPEGLLSVSTDYSDDSNVHRILKNRFNKKVFPVHRLDRETSGVMVFAYSELAKEHLKKLFYHHEITREYIAIVEGHLQKKKGTWESHLKEDPTYRVKSDPLGKLAITHYEVISESRHLTTLRVTLETGRKNQIRVHCSEAGNPIVGDKKYGSTRNSLGRMGLHAQKLGFVHPETGKKMLFESFSSITQ